MQINFCNTNIPLLQKVPKEQRVQYQQKQRAQANDVFKRGVISGSVLGVASFGFMHLIEKAQDIKIKNKAVLAIVAGIATLSGTQIASMIVESADNINKTTNGKDFWK